MTPQTKIIATSAFHADLVDIDGYKQLAQPNIERALITSVLFDPDIYPEVATQIDASDFYEGLNAGMWRTFEAIVMDGGVIDPVLVASYILTDKVMGQALSHDKVKKTFPDAEAVVTYYMTSGMSDNHYSKLVKIIQDTSAKIRLTKLNTELAKRLTPDVKVEDLTEFILEKQTEIFTRHSTEATDTTSLLDKYLKMLDTDGIFRAPFVHPEMTEFLNHGAAAGEIHVIGGKQGSGKTTIMLQQAILLGLLDLPVIWFSCEMSSNEMINILISMLSGVSKKDLAYRSPKNKRFLSREQEDLISGAIQQIYEWQNRFHIIDKYTSPTPNQMRIEIARIKSQYKLPDLGAVFLDGIWLASAGDSLKDTRRHQINGEITKQLKNIGKDNGCPTFATHQMNNKIEARPDNEPPNREDLSEGSEVINNADGVYYLLRDKERALHSNLYVMKYRGGSIAHEGKTFAFKWAGYGYESAKSE